MRGGRQLGVDLVADAAFAGARPAAEEQGLASRCHLCALVSWWPVAGYVVPCTMAWCSWPMAGDPRDVNERQEG
jgi:hypothetical protein